MVTVPVCSKGTNRLLKEVLSKSSVYRRFHHSKIQSVLRVLLLSCYINLNRTYKVLIFELDFLLKIEKKNKS